MKSRLISTKRKKIAPKVSKIQDRKIAICQECDKEAGLNCGNNCHKSFPDGGHTNPRSSEAAGKIHPEPSSSPNKDRGRGHRLFPQG